MSDPNYHRESRKQLSARLAPRRHITARALIPIDKESGAEVAQKIATAYRIINGQKAGDRVRSSDGKVYQVAKDGSVRRIKA